jgi:hypothetical protein
MLLKQPDSEDNNKYLSEIDIKKTLICIHIYPKHMKQTIRFDPSRYLAKDRESCMQPPPSEEAPA